MGMDADGMDYPNGSELGEIFAALESLKQELQVSITKMTPFRRHFKIKILTNTSR